jgi:hypothetical protein
MVGFAAEVSVAFDGWRLVGAAEIASRATVQAATSATRCASLMTVSVPP